MKQELDCPFDFTSRCTMGRCDCKPKQETLEEANKTHYLDELPNTDKDALLKMWNAAMPKLEPKQDIKQSAVEFAVKQLEQLIPFGHQLAVRIILDQAKEMEKQQIIDAHNNGKNILPPNESGQQYYNETFNNK